MPKSNSLGLAVSISYTKRLASIYSFWVTASKNGPLHFSRIEKWNFDFLTHINGNFLNFIVPLRPDLEKFLKKVFIFWVKKFIFALKIFCEIFFQKKKLTSPRNRPKNRFRPLFLSSEAGKVGISLVIGFYPIYKGILGDFGDFDPQKYLFLL